MAKTPIAIPIIFVPGIMGSRLINQNDKVMWDPGAGDTWRNAKERKARLIGKSFNKDFLKVAGQWGSTSDADEKFWKKHNLDAIDGINLTGLPKSPADCAKYFVSVKQPRRKRGWGGVLWESYGDFLNYLEIITREITLNSGNCHVYLPVYAHGYNWTASSLDSGAALAKTIDTAKAEMVGLGIKCEKVVIISHSMGGFVTRSCSELTGKRSDIYGVLHIAMPDNGSPATYKRMKAGFEGGGVMGAIVKAILGGSGQNVTAVLGHAPGGLELLPNPHYRMGDGTQGCWLTLEDKDDVLPLYQGSAETAYTESSQWWRLVNPEWLFPEGRIAKNQLLKVFESIFVNGTLAQAINFHKALGEKKHPNTWMVYSTGLSAWDRIRWRFKETMTTGSSDGYQNSLSNNNVPTKVLAIYQQYKAVQEDGTGTVTLGAKFEQMPYPLGSKTTTVDVSIVEPQASGDGTVHSGAGDFATGTVRRDALSIQSDHQDIMNNNQARIRVYEFIKTVLRDFADCSFTN